MRVIDIAFDVLDSCAAQRRIILQNIESGTECGNGELNLLRLSPNPLNNAGFLRMNDKRYDLEVVCTVVRHPLNRILKRHPLLYGSPQAVYD